MSFVAQGLVPCGRTGGAQGPALLLLSQKAVRLNNAGQLLCSPLYVWSGPEGGSSDPQISQMAQIQLQDSNSKIGTSYQPSAFSGQLIQNPKSEIGMVDIALPKGARADGRSGCGRRGGQARGLPLRPFLITECGIDLGLVGRGRKGWRSAGLSAEEYVRQLAWYNAELARDDYVIRSDCLWLRDVPGLVGL